MSSRRSRRRRSGSVGAGKPGTPGPGLAWRPPVPYRIALCLGQSVLVALPAAILWTTLWSHDALGWLILVVAAALCGWLAFRGWTISATLTRDALEIRKVFGVKRVALRDITRLGWSSRLRGLTVTERCPPSPVALPAAMSGRHHAGPAKRHLVPAVQLGLLAEAAGVRCAADEAADVIASAAGIPLLSPRKATVTHGQAVFAIPFSAALFASGFGLITTRNVATHFMGRMLITTNIALFFPVFLAVLGRFHGQRRA
jgi:hypothetical protein